MWSEEPGGGSVWMREVVSGRVGPDILHVDLDAFYASVEQLEDPSLAGRPVMVGGTGDRGVVAAASYEARTYGVHSAMPTVRARRLCPDGVFLPARHDLYADYSTRVFAILRDFTPLVEGISVDEAFLDVGGARRLFGPPVEVARAIKRRVRDEVGITCSVGLATTKLLAKLASDDAKPDGLLVIEPGRELAYLHPLPVERLWGVGPATRNRLDTFGVTTVGDLAAVPEESLVAALGRAQGRHLHALAWNRDDRPVTPEHEAKSVSAEETFPHDIADPDVLRHEVRLLAARVCRRLRRADLTGRTVTLKARFPDFSTVTRSTTLDEPTDSDGAVADAAIALLDRLDMSPGFRLIGVGVSNLDHPDARQEALPFDTARRPAVDAAVDAVRDRFGPDILRRG